MIASTDIRRSRYAELVLWALVGAVTGAVAGAVVTVCVVGFAVWNAVTSGNDAVFSPVVNVQVDSSGAIKAESGDGLLIFSLLGAAGGAALTTIGLTVWQRVKRKRRISGDQSWPG